MLQGSTTIHLLSEKRNTSAQNRSLFGETEASQPLSLMSNNRFERRRRIADPGLNALPVCIAMNESLKGSKITL